MKISFVNFGIEVNGSIVVFFTEENGLLITEKSENDKNIETLLLEIGKSINIDMDLRRLDRDEENIRVSINARISSNEELVKLNKNLTDILNPIRISIVDNQKLMPF